MSAINRFLMEREVNEVYDDCMRRYDKENLLNLLWQFTVAIRSLLVPVRRGASAADLV